MCKQSYLHIHIATIVYSTILHTANFDQNENTGAKIDSRREGLADQISDKGERREGLLDQISDKGVPPASSR